MRALIAVVLISIAVGTLSAQRPSNDWPQWRGPNRDGSAAAPTDAKAWPEQLTQKWKVDVGLGYATPLVIGNRIYQWARQGDREVMTAIDADSGKVLWQTGHAAPFTMHSAAATHGPGPKSTPVFANGRLYAIGMTGIVTAYDAASGKQLWQKPGSTTVPMYTTHSFSPIVDRGLVIFHLGGHNEGALTALDANTGDVKWTWKGDGPGYGSPILAEIAGTRQIITITQGKLVGVDAANGTLLWERPYTIANFTNSVTPVMYGQTLIVSGNGGPTTELSISKKGNEWVTETVWENADVPLRMSDAVVAGDVLFGMTTRNSGQYFAVDAKTGKTLWTSEGRQGQHAAIARAGDLFLSLEDDGELVVARNSKSAFEPLHRYKVADAATWTQAAYSGNRIFVKDVSSLAMWTLN
ncbi:MAG TPA: PQQ-binding-like beta-propeller repeat protein [Vicinamibacterales bacterium]|jgi:outer membrane protein assembly factor BamB